MALGGCLLGAGIAVGGFVLADWQQSQLDARQAATARQHAILLDALQEEMLNGPRLRLEELAALPLVPEFLTLTDEQPDGVDAQELKNYLQTVLEAAGQETGLKRIALVSAGGDELLATENPAAGSFGEDAPQLEAIVYDLDDPERPVGQLTGLLPDSTLTVLLPESTAASDITASIETGSTGDGNPPSATGIPGTTRLLATLAGLAAVLLGLTSAALLRNRRAE